MPSILSRLMPFIFLGIIIVILVVGIVLLSYLLIIGALVGMVLFAISWIKYRLFYKKDLTPVKRKKSGRTIDQ